MHGEKLSFYSGGCTLAGTFTAAADPVAAALLIAGSGRSDFIMRHAPGALAGDR